MAMHSVFVGAAFWDRAKSGTATAGLFRLDVAAGHWDSLNAGLPPQVEVRALAVSRTQPDTLFAGTHSGVYQTDDGGDRWRTLGIADAVIWSIAVHPSDERILYAGAENNAIYCSYDAGGEWTRLPTPAPRGLVKMGFPTRVVRIAIDPHNPECLFAGLEVGGVVRSTDGGKSWSDCNAALLEFATRDAYRSRIGSDTDTEGMMDSHAVLSSPTVEGTVYLANRMGLFQSQDFGSTWEDLEVGRFSPITYARDVRGCAHDPDRMFGALSVAAASDEGALYESVDRGQSWSRFDSGVTIDSTLMSVGTSYRTPDRVYAAARRGRVIGTEDGGSSWHEHQLPGNVQGVYAIACP